MDKADLVKRLQDLKDGVIRIYGFDPTSYYSMIITDAITFINTARDEVLENANARKAICGWLFSYNDRDPRWDDDYDVEADYGQDADNLLKRLRALKSTPAPKKYKRAAYEGGIKIDGQYKMREIGKRAREIEEAQEELKQARAKLALLVKAVVAAALEIEP